MVKKQTQTHNHAHTHTRRHAHENIQLYIRCNIDAKKHKTLDSRLVSPAVDGDWWS